MDSILPAKAASIPASASSTTAQSSGFTPNSFAANKKNANFFLLITVIILIIVLAEIIIEEINGERVVNFNAIMIYLFNNHAWKKERFSLICGYCWYFL